jgi:dipeptidyl aminopeptidase/acylaminoacyl peptidase
MRRLLLSLLAFAFTLPAFAQAKHPFTFDDMMKLKRVGDPQVSPDGKWVIFSVVDVDLEANTKTPHIWIVPLDSHVSQNQGDMGHPRSNTSESGVPHVSPNLRDVGGTERVLIADQDGDRPRWAPDGKRFAFLSTKEGGSQVWIAEFDGAAGTVTRVYRRSSMPTEASGELWSPDGKNILFVSDVYPQCDDLRTPNEFRTSSEEIGCNVMALRHAENSKVKALIFDHLLYRHWNAYKEGKRTHIFVIPADMPAGISQTGSASDWHEAARDLTPGDYDAPVFSLGGQDNYAFSPDGQEICYASNHDKSPAASTNNDLWIVPVSGGAAKNITADNPASDSTPLYSPDGRYIAYRAQQRPGYESDRFRLMIYDLKTGKKTNLTESFDRWVGTYIWAPDCSRLYFTSEDKGTSPVHSISFGTETIGGAKGDDVIIHETNIKIDALLAGFYDDLAISPNGKTLYFTQMTLQYPNRIRAQVLSFRGDGLVRAWVGMDRFGGDMPDDYCSPTRWDDVTYLEHLNDAVLSRVSMPGLECFWFTGAHDDKVQGFLVKPPNFDASKKYPVKFLIHGGPQGAWGDDWSYRWNPELFAAPTSSQSSGYVVVMINFHGSNGYGQKFMDAINGDWGGAPYEDLMKGLDYAEQTYPFIDKNRECALGASYGGYMANWILGHTDRFKCIVSHDGMFNAESAWGTTEELWFNDWEFKGTPYDNRAGYEKWSPHQYAKNFKTPTLVIHGQRDYRLDVSEGFQLFTTLQTMGVPSKMLYFPDEGHWVQKPQNSKLWYETVNAWVDQWTK